MGSDNGMLSRTTKAAQKLEEVAALSSIGPETDDHDRRPVETLFANAGPIDSDSVQ